MGKDQGGRLLLPLQLGDEQEPITLQACSEMHLKLIMLVQWWEELLTATVMKASEGPGYPHGGSNVPRAVRPSHLCRVIISYVYFYLISESAFLSARQMRLGTFPPWSLLSRLCFPCLLVMLTQ